MNSQNRQILYLILSVLGATLTWANNIEWMQTLEVQGPAALMQFWSDAFATPVSSSLAWDIIIVFAMGFVFVLAESRRLKMKYWPVLYFVLGNVIAAAFIFPLFMFFRERRLDVLAEVTREP